jgi:hypothetical protein
MAFFWPIVALLLAGFHLFRQRGREREPGEVPTVLLRYWLGVAIGIASIVGAAFHVFDAEQVAKEICFTRGDGGFQFENAMGDLSIGVAALLCLFIRDTRFWLAVIIVATIQFWGDAYGHIYQMVENDNHCPDNSGAVLWMDIAGPLVAIVLYLLSRRGGREAAS